MAAPERHIIKKYANRKLYDTRTSSYITLEGLAALVRDGHEIKVMDRETGQDLTQVTLSQIVLSEEKRGPSHLIDGGALQERGQALLDYVRKTLNVPSDLVNQMERRRGDLEGMVDEAIERALHRLRIPSHTDIDKINKRLDRISAQLKGVGLPAAEKAKKTEAWPVGRVYPKLRRDSVYERAVADDSSNDDVGLDPVGRLAHAAIRSQRLRHQVGCLRQTIGVADRGYRPRCRHPDPPDRDASLRLLDRNADHHSPVVDGDRFRTTDSKVVQSVLQVQRRQAGRVHDEDDARPMNRHQAFGCPQTVGLVGKHLVRSVVAAGSQRGLLLRQVGGFRLQRVVGAMEVVDEECERGGVGAGEAAFDLRLAPDLDGGHQRNEQGDEPDADRAAGCPGQRPKAG